MLKVHQNRIYIASPYKEVSGIILEEDSITIAQQIAEAAKAPKKAAKASNDKGIKATKANVVSVKRNFFILVSSFSIKLSDKIWTFFVLF